MKFEEVLPALREGKKIRSAEWSDYLHKSKECRDEVITVYSILRDDWEVIEENPYPAGTFQWAVWETQHKHECRLGDGTLHLCDREGLMVKYPRTVNVWWTRHIYPHDIFSTEWRHA